MSAATIVEQLRPAIAQTLAAARAPGLVLALIRGSQPAIVVAEGNDASERPLAADSLFPVASITKLATALAVLRLVDEGEIALDDALEHYLPNAAAARPGVTIRRLLSHSAGLPVDVAPEDAPYQPGLDWPALARACLATGLVEPPFTRVQYGNVGYGLLGLIVEQRTGHAFPDALEQLVLQPLGISGYLGVEPPRAPVQLADVRSGHAGSELAPFNSRFWRSLAMPWAGLVTDAAGILALVRAFHGVPAGYLSPGILAEATSNQNGDLAGGSVPPLIWPHCPWGLGPELRGEKQPHWAPATVGPDSFGHAGASGCVVWFDPASDLAYAILGARTATSGWLLRHGSALGAAILDAAR